LGMDVKGGAGLGLQGGDLARVPKNELDKPKARYDK